MGKGDKKTKRGKIIMGSFGVRRKHKPAKTIVLPVTKKHKEKPPKNIEEVKEPKVVEPVLFADEPEVTPKETKAKAPAKKKTTAKTTAKKTTKSVETPEKKKGDEETTKNEE